MKKKTRENVTSLWDKLSQKQKAVIIIFFLIVLIPFFIVNGGLIFCNFLFHIIGWNINASGLGNTEWLAFWGTYFGGIATMLSIWWTVSQTERHFKQTSDEQKRQNKTFENEQERKRKLDVLPLILLQPRITLQTSNAAILFRKTEDSNNKKKLIPLDQLKPVYEEFDMSEITVLLAPEPEIRIGGLTEEEMCRVEKNGYDNIASGERRQIVKTTITFPHPFWFINAGREAAINIQIYLAISKKQRTIRLHHVFSLMSKRKLKLNFLVDVKMEQVESVSGEYLFVVIYDDIYANQYHQKFPINLNPDDGGSFWEIELGVQQVLGGIELLNRPSA